jgi:NADPH:quinone reductase-like Zn-dependent oxidoreductase
MLRVGSKVSFNMAANNTKYLVKEKGGSLIPISTLKPTITQPNEVMIHMQAIAINPTDATMIDYGGRVTSWHFVPGLDGAGIVEEVGPEVKKVAVGDTVLALFTVEDRGGSY